MLGTVLIVILVLALFGALPRWSQPGVGVCADRRLGIGSLYRGHSPGARAHLSDVSAGNPVSC
jgi:hypothetical protein